MLVITASLCTTWTFSTCSFENTRWWTQVNDKKGENSVHLLSLPQFCSQASSLLAPTVTVSLRAVRVEASSNPTPGICVWFQLPMLQVRQQTSTLLCHTYGLLQIILKGWYHYSQFSLWSLSPPSPCSSGWCPFLLSATWWHLPCVKICSVYPQTFKSLLGTKLKRWKSSISIRKPA